MYVCFHPTGTLTCLLFVLLAVLLGRIFRVSPFTPSNMQQMRFRSQSQGTWDLKNILKADSHCVL
jgi:hypothetical protein